MKKTFASVLLATLCGTLWGAEIPVSAPPPAVPVETVTVTTPTAFPAKILGTVDLRPGYRSHAGQFLTENNVLLGYQFTSGYQVGYKQEFNTNLYHATPAGGLDLYAYDGYLRVKSPDIWKDSSTGLSLSYEGRAYAPTYAKRRDAGMITAIRNGFKLKKGITQSLNVSIEEIPIVHLYSQPGSVTGKKSAANPAFENRIYFNVEYFPFERVKLLVPLQLSSTRYRSYFTNALNHDQWGHYLGIHPELTYALTPQVNVGLAYRSENLINSDFSNFNTALGFKTGVTQMILQASL